MNPCRFSPSGMGSHHSSYPISQGYDFCKKMQPINKKEPPTHIKSESVAFALVVRNSVSEDFVVTYAVLVYPTAITGVSLNGINDTVFYFLNNTGVVGLSILRTR